MIKKESLYLVPTSCVGYADVDALRAAVDKDGVDLSKVFVVRGTSLRIERKVVVAPWFPDDAPASKPRTRPEPPLPTEEVLAAVRIAMADGKGRTKVKVREVTGLPVDVCDRCVDWFTHRGDMVKVGKTYTMKQGGAA